MRRLFETLLTVGGAIILVLVLVTFDERVREQIGAVVDGRHSTAALAGVTDKLGEVGSIVMLAVHDQGVEHAPLVIFALAATVLVLFMLRT